VGYNVSTLSGGNQQKIMIGKWLAAHPRLIIMDEPTRGIDGGAKFEIHRMIRGLVESGLGVIVITSDLPEAIGLCDRIVVMCEGIISGEVGVNDMTEEKVITCASKRDQQN
jgi:ribose transport system ATP-binding protein